MKKTKPAKKKSLKLKKKAVVKKSPPKKIGLLKKLKKAIVKKIKPVRKVKKVLKKKPLLKKAVSKKVVIKKIAKKRVAPKKAAKKPVSKKLKVNTAKPVKKVGNIKEESVENAYQPVHKSVMMKEVLENLDLAKRKVVVDCTLGLGGHAKEMLQLMPAAGKLIGFDADSEHLKLAKKTLKEFKDDVIYVHDNFSNLAENLEKLKIKGVDAILFDLGLASPHVDMGERGFSFLREGPLDMRFNIMQQLTAEEVINKYSEKELLRIFREFGEEKRSRKLAMEIVIARKRKPFKTTMQLADFVEKLMGRQGHIHPATRIFQALRIEVNHELDVLLSALTQAVEVLKPGGLIVVIAYHSLEDRIVKMFFKDNSRDWINLPNEMTTTHLIPKLKTLTKKPLEPSEAEVKENPRSRSAKLRVAEKI